MNKPTSIIQGITSQRSIGDGVYFLVFYLCIGLLPTFVTFIGDKALHVPYITIALLTTMVVLLRPRFRKLFLGELIKPYFLLLLAFFGLLFVHAILGIASDSDRLRIIQKPMVVLLLLFVIGCLLTNRQATRFDIIADSILLGTILALIYVALETLWAWYFTRGVLQLSYPVSGIFNIDQINRGLEVLSILLFFGGLGAKGNKRWIFDTLALAVLTWISSTLVLGAIPREGGWYLSYHVDSETVQFGLPLALMVFLLAIKMPRLMTDLVFAAIVVVLLSAPWIFRWWYTFAIDLALPKIHEILVRSEIWHGVSGKILESPLLGYGIDSARYLQHITLANTYQRHSNIWHPHNMFLQIWLDIGLVGVLIVCGLVISSWIAIRKSDPITRPAILASITMLALFCLVTHSFWQTWSMSLIATVSIIITIMINYRPDKTERTTAQR